MRLLSNKEQIKLLVVDEPTSALDSVAELDVFDNFRTEGVKDPLRTIIFVSHRFGKLVHHADLIL